MSCQIHLSHMPISWSVSTSVAIYTLPNSLCKKKKDKIEKIIQSTQFQLVFLQIFSVCACELSNYDMYIIDIYQGCSRGRETKTETETWVAETKTETI